MPLGTQVGFGPDDFVLDGDPALPPKKVGGVHQIFGTMFIVVKRLDGLR